MTQHATSLDSDRSYQIFGREADNTALCIKGVKVLQEARSRFARSQKSD
jgi:hypothetical protein